MSARNLPIAATVIACLCLLVWALTGGGEASTPLEPEAAVAADAEPSPPAMLPERQRASRPRDASVAGAAPEAASPPEARLRIVVQRAATGRPVSGARVRVDQDEHESGIDGIVELAVSAGLHPVTANPPPGEQLIAESGWLTVAAGETTEVTMELRATSDLEFWGRLVNDDGTPAAGARLLLRDRTATRATLSTSATGTFHVAANREDGYVEVQADGLAPTLVAVVPGHETESRALDVRIAAQAVLEAIVQDPGLRRITDAVVSARLLSRDITQPTGLYRGPVLRTFEAPTDARGVATIAGLPPGVPLELRIERGGRAFAELSALLEPGRNVREFEIARAGSVSGRVVDQHGAPVAGVRVGAAPDDGEPHRTLPLARRPERASPARTDDDGRFELRGLPAGTWLVGPAPAGRTPAAMAALPCTTSCVRVVVEAGRDAAVEVAVFSGLTITGRARGPDGEPARNVGITARSLAGDHASSARTDDAGGFRLGPLLPEDYELETTEGFDSPFGLRERVRIRAGTDGVELQLAVVGADVDGRLVTADGGRPTRGWVTLRSRDTDAVVAQRAALDGRFRFTGVPTGVWHVVAHDRQGRAVIVPDLEVIAGVALTALEFALEPAGFLVLRHGPAPGEISFEVMRDGRVFHADFLAKPGAPGSVRLTVPPGRWTVRFLVDGRETGRYPAEVSAGADTDVSAGW